MFFVKIFLLCGIVLFSGVSEAFAAPTVQEKSSYPAIEVTGYGSSEDEALKNAFKNVVEQSVGVLVDSSTVIQNQQLIENNILTFSNGYIEKYNLLSKKEQLGLWEIKINAIVKQQDVLEKIKVLNIQTKEIDNVDQIYAQAISSVKSKFDAEALLINFFKNIVDPQYSNLYRKCTINNVFVDIDKATRESVPVTINYTLGYDMEKYAKTVKEAESLFHSLGAILIEQVAINETNKNIYTKTNREATDFYIVFQKNNHFYINIWRFPKSFSVIYPFKDGDDDPFTRKYSGTFSLVIKNKEQTKIVEDTDIPGYEFILQDITMPRNWFRLRHNYGVFEYAHHTYTTIGGINAISTVFFNTEDNLKKKFPITHTHEITIDFPLESLKDIRNISIEEKITFYPWGNPT